MKSLKTLLLLSLATLFGCTSKPDGVEPVNNFELQPYLGKWYEIARLDHSFERGLSNVTAEYELREDGGVTVINRGYSEEDKEWTQADGKAYFVDGENTGHLKVSFFGPFYSSYIVFELGENYDYAFISGFNHDYLWLLSRTPTVDKATIERFKKVAQEKGFALDELILVDQTK
ncbi:MAG: lipocalin family protein [Pseudomonadota bacterium]|jgi:apolipoprotein D and lipocalin family protein|uniref:Outer membrane lipoprotein Blc n=1 Tax=Vibrio campbellii TaxID=680 RepID=A0AAE9N5M0_9VIBR|nr:MULTISPECIES: lipocalin family protein [Vibrio]MED5506028.1 lipocalin family protein [Pseudomonadota bacterium]AXB34512.1 lipocalin [Vibrio campbellii]MCC4224720.1 lipocalin family protein [Vibrio campbellii]MDK9773516.1 lipocalin family protein [Vibrio sp. B181a]UTZ24888.1 lipocalin [Vibrio campbellii]